MNEKDDLSEKIINETMKNINDTDINLRVDELMEIVLNSREQGQMMEQFINSQIKIKDDLINKLHKELEFYKKESTDKFIDQLMKAVIKIRKDMMRRISSEDFLSADAELLRKEYKYILEDITDLLEQQNIDAYSTESGVIFDASIHQPKIEITDDPKLDKKLKTSLSDGYRKGEKVLIPERVIVYQYKA